jgi:heterodisulfide reductase subunit C
MTPLGGATLRHIVLAQSGQDPRACMNCDACEALLTDEMDLSYGQIVRAAARNDEMALTNRTIWRPEFPPDGNRFCQAELDLAAILDVLRQEARRRGIRPPGERASGCEPICQDADHPETSSEKSAPVSWLQR